MGTVPNARRTLGEVAESLRGLYWGGALRLEMLKSLEHDPYLRKISAIHRLLGIPSDYSERGLELHREPKVLVDVSCGLDGKKRKMTPFTRDRFIEMASVAKKDGVEIAVKWAYRSAVDQARLIRRHLRWGSSLSDVLTWAAAPGFSEHHTGCALDIEAAAKGDPFERTDVFSWLVLNAGNFNFFMTYPEGNGKGIIYEPWHWFCCPD